MVNMTYDVPVKLFSTNLLLMAVFLAAPDAKRLLDVMVLNRGVAPKTIRPLFSTRLATRLASAIVVVFVGLIVSQNITRGLEYYRTLIGPNAPKPPVYGIWDVESLTKNGVDQPPLLSDSTRLKRIIFGGFSRATCRLMSDSVERYAAKFDSVKHEIALTGRFNPKAARTMSYTRPDANHLVLTGTLGNDSVVVRLRRFDENRFLLMNRGYHWIQELPFNR